MTEHVYETADGERDIFDVKRKTLKRNGKTWRYSHPLIGVGDIQPGAIIIEPDWAHTVYQAGDEESAAWRKMGGDVDPVLNMPRIRNREEIDRYRGMTRDMHKGRQDNRFDFGVFRG